MLNSLQRKYVYCEVLKTISFALYLYKETRRAVPDFEIFRSPHYV